MSGPQRIRPGKKTKPEPTPSPPLDVEKPIALEPASEPASKEKPHSAASAKLGTPTGTINGPLKIAYGKGKPWAPVNAHDPFFIKHGEKWGVSPVFLKSMEVVESGGEMIPNGNGFPNWGNMQLTSKEFGAGYTTPWDDIAKKLGVSIRDASGQIEIAAYALGGNHVWKGTPEEVFLRNYYPTPCLDCPGQDGHTPREYLHDIAELTRQINVAAGVQPPLPSGPAYKTEADILAMLSSRTAGVYISFGYGLPNIGPNGPVNIYRYGVGHLSIPAAQQGRHAHPGIDVWMPDNTAVGSLFDGKVICVGEAGSVLWDQGCGYFSDDDGGIGKISVLHDVEVEIGGKMRQLELVYGHMSSATVKPGDRVKLGQIIGRSGKGGGWAHVHLDAVINAPDLNNPQIWLDAGVYHLPDPIPTILKAAGAQPPVDNRPRVVFAGSTRSVPMDVPFRIVLMPQGQTRQRPGVAMISDRIDVHETGNYNPGMDAQAHLRYMQNGAPDDHGNPQTLGYHFTVDQDEVIQMIPGNEHTWHGGDGPNGVCNRKGLSIETCVHDNNAHKVPTRHNLEQLVAALRLAFDVSIVEQHSDCCKRIGNPSGCHQFCPESIRKDGYWPTLIANVNALVAGGAPDTGPAPPTYAVPMAPPPWTGEDVKVNAVIFRAARRVYMAAKDGVAARKYASPTSDLTRAPLPNGEKFEGWYIVKGEDGEDWIVTKFGSRITMADASPIVTIK